VEELLASFHIVSEELSPLEALSACPAQDSAAILKSPATAEETGVEYASNLVLSKGCAKKKLDQCSPIANAEKLSSKPLKIPLFGLASGRNQVDDQLGISLQQLTQHVPFRHVPHRHDFYHVVWIESGSGTFIRDGRSYPVTSGSLIFVPPGQVHTWKWKETLQGYVLSFEPALLFSQTDRPYRLLHELTQWSTAAKNQGQVNRILRNLVRGRFEDLAREFSSDEEFRHDMVRAQVTALLICIHRLCIHRAPIDGQERFDSLTSSFFSLLQREQGKFHRASRYSTLLSVNLRALVKAVLSETGKSPSAWIRDQTLLESRRLVTYTDLTISEIAYRLNFRNVSYFVRFYRRLTGMSPGAARNKQ
jgi:AraC-like DNA-binding protein/mannose-6-phosphate isomerase-like protein (cupin superfamily)